MTFTCTSWSLPLLSFEDVIRIMSVLGFRAIDVGAFAGFVHFEPADLARRPREMAGQLVELGQRNSMAFTDLFLTFGKELAHHCVNFPDHGIRQENAEMLKRIIDFCHEAGIPGITLCPGVEHVSLGRRSSLQLAINELARLSEIGHEGGLRVSFEPHVTSIAETPEEAMQIVNAAPWLSLTLDYSHFVAQGYTPGQLECLLDRTAHFHVRQAKPGKLQARNDEGTIDFERALCQLQKRGYSGAVAFEYEWNAWQGNNQTDVISETVLLKRRLAAFETRA